MAYNHIMNYYGQMTEEQIMPMNIAIDGPVGAGKSSIADMVAKKLNILHLDTGAMYRTFGLYALRSGVDMTSEEALSKLVEQVDIQVKYVNGAQQTLLFGEDVSELIRTETMAERKTTMNRLGEAYIALPGGPGTLEEIAEVISQARLQVHSHPCIFLSDTGFYEPLKQYMDAMIREGFWKAEEARHVHFAGSVQEAAGIIMNASEKQ